MDVEEECLHTLALYQPVAQDLRYVVAILKINNDLERIADLAVNIAKQAHSLSKETPPNVVPFDLPGMTKTIQSMLKNSLDALVNLDPDLAQSSAIRMTGWMKFTARCTDRWSTSCAMSPNTPAS